MTATPYDQIWSGGWDDMRRYGPMARHSRRLMQVMTRGLTPRSILDVGCGEGSMLVALAEAHPGAALAGVEISENAVALARRGLPDAEVSALDVAAAKLDRTFDLVVCADVVEHIADDQAALNNMAAMTAAGGAVVVATLQGRMRRFETDIGHMRNYAKGELAAKMTAAGLTVDKVIEWGFPFYSPLYRDLLEVIGNRGTIGAFGTGKKLMSQLIYMVFLLNSAQRGDYIFVRGRKA
ncbi:MAG: class I SAM-dependent methyltransferase [Rhodospirillaceae bacterium]